MAEREPLSETERYAKAERVALALRGIAGIIPTEERKAYGIPDVLDQRLTRNTLVSYYLGRISNQDGNESLQAIQGIIRWLTNDLSNCSK